MDGESLASGQSVLASLSARAVQSCCSKIFWRRGSETWLPSLGECSMRQSCSIGIGGAAGQGVATPGDIFAKIFSRRGLHLNAYNAYQSIIRGGHTFLTIRTGPDKISNTGDRIDLLIPLNQDTMDRHLGLLTAGGACLYNSDLIKPGTPAAGVPNVSDSGVETGRHQPQ